MRYPEDADPDIARHHEFWCSPIADLVAQSGLSVRQIAMQTWHRRVRRRI